MTLPTLFVPHGAPTLALRPGAAGAALVTLAQQLERPKAVIVVSPHWETQEPRVGSARDLELAQRVAQCLQDAGYPARIDPHRGLDHGAWDRYA